MKKTFPIQLLAITLLSLTGSYGAALVTQVAFDSGSVLLKNLDGTTNLTGGSAADGNGAVIQLGYFSAATIGTATSNFLGTWVPLTGEGSANSGGSIAGSVPFGQTFNTTSMGDNGGANGEFGITVVFNSDIPGTFNNLPGSASIPLSIRIYNGTTIAGSTAFNTVSNDSWLWKLPAMAAPLPPTVNMSLGASVTAPALKWQSVNIEAQAGTAGRTSIPTGVPEPTSAALLMLGLVSLASRRRRVATV